MSSEIDSRATGMDSDDKIGSATLQAPLFSDADLPTLGNNFSLAERRSFSKPSSLLLTEANISFHARKMWNVFLYHASQEGLYDGQLRFKISFDYFLKLMSTDDYEYTRANVSRENIGQWLSELTSNNIYILAYVDGRKESKFSSKYISGIKEWDPRSRSYDYIGFNFDPELGEELSKNGYIFDLNLIKHLSKTSEFVLCEMFTYSRKYNERLEFSLIELEPMLNDKQARSAARAALPPTDEDPQKVSDRLRTFKRRNITMPVEKLNQVMSDFNCIVEDIREGRKVVGVAFYTTPKETEKTDNINVIDHDAQQSIPIITPPFENNAVTLDQSSIQKNRIDEIIAKMTSVYLIDESELMKLVMKFPFTGFMQHYEEALRAMDEHAKKGTLVTDKVKSNVGAYCATILKRTLNKKNIDFKPPSDILTHQEDLVKDAQIFREKQDNEKSTNNKSLAATRKLVAALSKDVLLELKNEYLKEMPAIIANKVHSKSLDELPNDRTFAAWVVKERSKFLN